MISGTTVLKQKVSCNSTLLVSFNQPCKYICILQRGNKKKAIKIK